ncbi:MAG: SpoIIE family protein phosphatase [Victivallales bacterium]|nr:SpoIIE family protein phosphatase [Victivallales bacterium]MCF7888723.1 SpoIIE family protein phosphatase [Victivallales bacterium]
MIETISPEFVKYFLSTLFIIILSLLVAVFIYRNKLNSVKGKLNQTNIKLDQLNDFMNFFSLTISKTEKFHDVYSSIAQHIANITDAKNICIYELEDNGNVLIPVGYTKTFPPLQLSKSFVLSRPRYTSDSLKHEKIKIGEGLIGEVAETRKGILLEDATGYPHLKAANNITPIYTLMAIPMMSNDELAGVICAVNTKGKKSFTQVNYDTLNSMTKLIVQIHNIIKAYSSLSVQQRLSQELEFARLLQTSLLPTEAPDWSPFVIHAFSRSAKEVSGDFYDFVKVDDNRMLVVIGDASGKGIPACMVMAMARSFIRANVERFTTLEDLLLELNTNLYRDTTAGRFATLSCCLLNRKEETVEYGRAGHTELLCYSRKNKARKIIPHGTALGLLPPEITGNYDTFSFVFKPYYTIMLFTDGITEATDSSGQEYGIDRLHDIFLESCKKKNSPRKATELTMRSVNDFSESQEQADDQTIVTISHIKAFI